MKQLLTPFFGTKFPYEQFIYIAQNVSINNRCSSSPASLHFYRRCKLYLQQNREN